MLSQALAAAVAPLGGEHDEVERVHRLDLQPAGAAPAGGVGRVERLHDHALVARAHCVGEHRAGGLGVRRDRARHAQRLGHDGREPLGAGGARLVEDVLAVDVQDVEEQRRERHVAARRAEVAGRDLERLRAAVGAQRDRLAVEHDAAHGQRERGLHELRHARGDVVERAREDGDVAAVAVDLDAHAVELPLDGRGAELLHRGRDVGGGGGEHRAQRAADLEAERLQRVDTAGDRGRRHRPEVAAQHQRPPQVGGGDLGGARGRVRHHALERALAQLARQQRAQEALLALGRLLEQRGQRRAPGRLRAGPAEAADARERGVDLAHAQRRPERRRGQLPQRRPADADLALAQLARQERDGDRGLVRRGRAQHRGQRLDLAAAGARRGDGLGGGDEVGEQHADIVPYSRSQTLSALRAAKSLLMSVFRCLSNASWRPWSIWK